MPEHTRTRIGQIERVQPTRTSCGFCESAQGQEPGVCRDAGHHCKGTWPHFVKKTPANPQGDWTCACSAAGHPGRQEQAS